MQVAVLGLTHWSAMAACRGRRDLCAATGQLAAVLTGLLVAAPPTRRAFTHSGSVELAAVAVLWSAVALCLAWCAVYWRPDRDVVRERLGVRLAVVRARRGELRAELGVADLLAEHRRVTSRLHPAERDAIRRRAEILAAQVDRAAADALEVGLVRLRGGAVVPGSCATAGLPAFWELIGRRREELAALVAEAELSEGGPLALAAHLEAELEVARCDGVASHSAADALSAR